MTLVLAIGGNPSARSILKSTNLVSFKHEVVKYLSVEYDGDCIFEFSALSTMKKEGVGRLDGMDRRHHGHAWIETTTTNISDPSGKLSFKYVRCMVHLQCTIPRLQVHC